MNETHKDRLFHEFLQLEGRIQRLNIFLAGNKDELTPEKRELMRQQLKAMDEYRRVLSLRIKLEGENQ